MNMASNPSQKCVICGNRRTATVPRLLLAALPLDPTRCQQWVQAIGQQDLIHLPIEKLHQLKFVCGMHFAAEDFNRNKSRLLKTAVPKLNLPLPPLPQELFGDFPQRIGCQSEELPRTILSDCTSAVLNQNINQASETPAVEDVTMNIVQPKAVCTDMENPITPTPVVVREITSSVKIGVTDSAVFEPEQSTSTSVEVLVRSHARKAKTTVGSKQLNRCQEEKLMQRLKTAKDSLKALAKTSINLDELDSIFLKNLLKNTLKNQKRKLHGKRWDMKSKIFSLAIFKRSPKTFRYLQKLLQLPSEKTLHRIIKSIPMETGINQSIIENLKKVIAESPDRDKTFALLFDEMALKKRLIYNECTDKVEGYVDLGQDMGRYPNIADHALVFMIQGICKAVKQPVAYYFVEGTISSEKLSMIIKKIIITLRNAGIHIITTVCDQGPTNIGALNLLKKLSNVTAGGNFFLVEENKIYIMYDIPHLFKSIRNNFYQAGEIKYCNKTGKWRHLIEAENRNKNFLNFVKLNQTVVNPTYKNKMKVKYAAHALSNTMAAVLKMMALKHETEEREINGTAYIIEELDRLFDATNGPSSYKDVKKGIRENVSSKSNHIEKWNQYLKKIDSIKFMKSDSQLQLKNVRCIHGFRLSLQSLKDIWWQLNTKEGLKYLNLRQLNQDALENLFGLIRQHGVTNKNPTCSHFTAALKTVLISGYTAAVSRGGNCEEDQNKFYLKFQSIILGKQEASTELANQPEQEENQIEDNNNISFPEEFYVHETDLTSFEEQPIVYVSGYIAAKLMFKNSCEMCKKCLKNENPVNEDGLYNYISLREWWNDKISLTYQCDTIAIAKNTFQNVVAKELHNENIASLTTLQLMVHCNVDWIVCSEHHANIKKTLFDIISKMFIRKQCQILNNTAKIGENEFADFSKRAQQQSKEK